MNQEKLFTPVEIEGYQSNLPFVEVIPVSLENPNQFILDLEGGEQR